MMYQMEKANNRDSVDEPPTIKEGDLDSASGNGSYYYDDSTGYELYHDDDESGDDPEAQDEED